MAIYIGMVLFERGGASGPPSAPRDASSKGATTDAHESVVSESTTKSPLPKAVSSAVASGPSPVGSILPPSSLRASFLNSTNYAAFVNQALSDKTPGATFYAWLAYTKCVRHERLTIKNSAGDTSEMVEAKQLLAKHAESCRGVIDTYGEDATFQRLLKDQRLRQDAFFPPDGKGIIYPGSLSEAQAALAIAQRSGDPNFLGAVLEVNAEVLAPEVLTGELKSLPSELYYSAVSAAACRLRQDCDDPMLHAARCAFQGQCTRETYSSWVRSQVKESERPLFDAVVARLINKVKGT